MADTLSDKISRYHQTEVLLPKDVKEFIKKIKEYLSMGTYGVHRIHRVIDKLAGDKLI